MEMTLKQRIDRFCEKYPEPEQFQFQLEWERKDGVHTAVMGTGIPLNTWRSNLFTRNTGRPLYLQHYLYDEETQLMELSYAVIKCNVPKPGEDRKWEYAERYFIPKEEKKLYDKDGKCEKYTVHQSYEYDTVMPKYFLKNFARLNCNHDMFCNAFGKLTDNAPDLPPRYEKDVKNMYPWILPEWFVHKPKNKNKITTTQQIINELTEDYLETNAEIKHKIMSAFNDGRNENRWSYARRYAYFDKSHMVFRIYNITNGGEDIIEKSRIYMHKGKFIITKLEGDKWVVNGSFTSDGFNAYVVNLDEFYSLKYKGYLKDLGTERVYDIVKVMKNPEIEQLYNMGCVKLATHISSMEFPNAYMKHFFGEPQKKKNVCQKYGLTKEQFDIINTCTDFDTWYYRSNRDVISRMKELLMMDNLSHIDIESFGNYYATLDTLKSYSNGYFMRNANLAERKQGFIKMAKLRKEHTNAVQLFVDTYSLFNRAENPPDVVISQVKNYAELVRLHDTLNEIVRIENEERNRLYRLAEEERNKELEKKMAKLDEKRKELNYEEDDFIIRIPEKLSEIVNEGSNLHHCVGSYTDRHASGSTTILFLRRKNNPNTSFYTIELTRDNVIQQIHGFGNRWLGNNPEAIPTVARWLRKNNIKCTDQILRGTATGYCGNNILVDMPEI